MTVFVYVCFCLAHSLTPTTLYIQASLSIFFLIFAPSLYLSLADVVLPLLEPPSSLFLSPICFITLYLTFIPAYLFPLQPPRSSLVTGNKSLCCNSALLKACNNGAQRMAKVEVRWWGVKGTLPCPKESISRTFLLLSHWEKRVKSAKREWERGSSGHFVLLFILYQIYKPHFQKAQTFSKMWKTKICDLFINLSLCLYHKVQRKDFSFFWPT